MIVVVRHLDCLSSAGAKATPRTTDKLIDMHDSQGGAREQSRSLWAERLPCRLGIKYSRPGQPWNHLANGRDDRALIRHWHSHHEEENDLSLLVPYNLSSSNAN